MPIEEEVPSRSATDTGISQSKAEDSSISERDFLKDMEREENKRRTVRFIDDKEDRKRPRADQVMKDLEL
jgi:hypothetical protein